MAEVKAGELTVEEGASGEAKTIDTAEILTDSLADAAGGMGRHLGVFSCTMLMYVLSYLLQPIINVLMLVLVV
jgi:hypothetical protein